MNPPFTRLTPWRGELAILLAGLVYPLAFAPFGWFPFAWLSVAVCFVLLPPDLAPRRALLRGWLYGLGLFGVGVSWVYVSIHFYGNAGMAASGSIALALVAAMAVYPALLAWIAARLPRVRGWRRNLLLLPALWVLLEWLRGWILTGFPWINLGYSQIDAPFAGFAPLFGVYGVSLVTALLAGLLAQAWHSRHDGWAPGGWLAAGLVLLLAGLMLNTAHWTRPEGRPIQVSLLQGNIAQNLKWLPEERMATLERYFALTRRAHEAHSRIIVWPETAIPAFYHQVEDDLLPRLQEAAERWKVDFLIGIPVLERESWRYYNAVMSLGHDHGFYYKQHLVPFGEYMPLRPLLENALEVLDLAMADFSEGAPDQTPLRAAGQAIGTSICYEAAFGEEVIRALPEARLLVNVSNDGWFGDSLAPHQHLEIARMRARETERYMLRATNTGISAIIDHHGKVQERSPQFEVAVVTGKVQPRSGATPYVIWGNGPAVTLAVLVLAGMIGVPRWREWRERRRIAVAETG